MADYKYAYNGPVEGVAKAVLLDAPVSRKVAIEMCNYLRGRTTVSAKGVLERVLEMREAIPYRRFPNGAGHKPGVGIGAGRYPLKASALILGLIKVAEANASSAGLADDLVIVHLIAQQAARPARAGRQGRRQMKRVHVEIVVKEAPEGKGRKAKALKPKAPVVQKAEKPKTAKPVEHAPVHDHHAEKEAQAPAPAKPSVKKAPKKEKAPVQEGDVQ